MFLMSLTESDKEVAGICKALCWALAEIPVSCFNFFLLWQYWGV
jgi:hypothetical protein